MQLRSTIFLKHLAVWLAAYAFVLQAMLAPIAATAATRIDAGDSTQAVLCAEHVQTSGQDQPVAPHHDDSSCKLCLGCPAGSLLTPDVTATAVVIGFSIAAIHWHAVSDLAPGRHLLASKQARGPPQLT